MSDGSYDASKVIEALYESPVVSTDINVFDVGSLSQIVVSINTDRNMVLIQNEGSPCYIKFGLNAGLDDYSIRLSANAFLSLDKYGGFISAIRNGATNKLRITEIK